MSNVREISITQGIGEQRNLNCEQLISYIARVSNKENQMNVETSERLLKYCIKNQHWSVFEQGYLTLEINTCRAIARQILRHRGFTFQEFSQRYQKVEQYEEYKARRQDKKNRQNSIDDMQQEDKEWFQKAQRDVWEYTREKYNQALQRGIAKEQARFMLSENTKTTMYMTGNVRNWIHYIQLRIQDGTQQEHQEIANQCKKIFKKNFENISAALGW